MNGTQIQFGHFGRDITKAASVEEALRIAGLDWNVDTVPAMARIGNKLVEVPGQKAVVRTDTLQPLGIVGNKYKVFQNMQSFGIAQELLKAGAQLVRGGSFADGAGVYLSLKLDGGIRIGAKDSMEKYLTLVTTHDATMQYKGLFTPYRVFCSNQLRAILGRGDGFSIRHTASGEELLGEAHNMLKASVEYYDRFGQMANVLAQTKFADNNMAALAEKMFPAKAIMTDENENGEEVVLEEEVTVRTQNKRETLVALFDGGMGHRETGIAGTAWGAVNAVAEYVDHHRTTRGAGNNEVLKARQRLNSAYFGPGAQMKAKAFDIVLEMVGMKKPAAPALPA